MRKILKSDISYCIHVASSSKEGDYWECMYYIWHCHSGVFLLGEKNSCYLPNSTYTTYNLVKEAHPNQQYSWTQIPNYGHLDCICGRDAVHDVYPHILKALDAHAHDSLHLNDSACCHVFKAVNSLMCKSGMSRLG